MARAHRTGPVTGRGQGRTGSSLLAVPLVIAAGVALVVVASRAGASRADTDAVLCATTPAATGIVLDGQRLDPVQVGNARLIYRVGTGLRVPRQASVIAIATAMQESKLENVPYGTKDSLGLFQQRPSHGWGTPAEVMRPASAAAAFYTRLIRIPGWQELPLAVAAQDVQQSAYPDAYAQWQPLATDLATAFSGCARQDARPGATATAAAIAPGESLARPPSASTGD